MKSLKFHAFLFFWLPGQRSSSARLPLGRGPCHLTSSAGCSPHPGKASLRPFHPGPSGRLPAWSQSSGRPQPLQPDCFPGWRQTHPDRPGIHPILTFLNTKKPHRQSEGKKKCNPCTSKYVHIRNGCWPTCHGLKTQQEEQRPGDGLSQASFHWVEGHSRTRSGLGNHNCLGKGTQTYRHADAAVRTSWTQRAGICALAGVAASMKRHWVQTLSLVIEQLAYTLPCQFPQIPFRCVAERATRQNISSLLLLFSRFHLLQVWLELYQLIFCRA